AHVAPAAIGMTQNGTKAARYSGGSCALGQRSGPAGQGVTDPPEAPVELRTPDGSCGACRIWDDPKIEPGRSATPLIRVRWFSDQVLRVKVWDMWVSTLTHLTHFASWDHAEALAQIKA